MMLSLLIYSWKCFANDMCCIIHSSLALLWRMSLTISLISGIYLKCWYWHKIQKHTPRHEAEHRRAGNNLSSHWNDDHCRNVSLFWILPFHNRNFCVKVWGHFDPSCEDYLLTATISTRMAVICVDGFKQKDVTAMPPIKFSMYTECMRR